MCFKIYAYEEVEKKGKLSRESLGGRDSITSGKSPFDGRGKYYYLINC